MHTYLISEIYQTRMSERTWAIRTEVYSIELNQKNFQRGGWCHKDGCDRAVNWSNFFDTIRYNTFRCDIRYIGWTIYWKILGVKDQKHPRTVMAHTCNK